VAPERSNLSPCLSNNSNVVDPRFTGTTVGTSSPAVAEK
jgi:hypothetical protein